MKTKLEMAHEWAMKHGDAETVGSRQNMIKYAWDYADTMQAEADKRSKAEAEQKRKAVREMLNDANTFVEREGQHFDDVADIQKPYSSSEEWQPDWSQAPDNLVKYFAVDENGRGGWFIIKPILCSDHWYWSDFEERVDNDHYDHAPSFGYTGDWRESLRKRPE